MQTIYGWMTGFAALYLLLRIALLAQVLGDAGGSGRIGQASLGVLVGVWMVAFNWMLHRRVRAKAGAASKPFWVRTFEVF